MTQGVDLHAFLLVGLLSLTIKNTKANISRKDDPTTVTKTPAIKNNSGRSSEMGLSVWKTFHVMQSIAEMIDKAKTKFKAVIHTARLRRKEQRTMDGTKQTALSNYLFRERGILTCRWIQISNVTTKSDRQTGDTIAAWSLKKKKIARVEWVLNEEFSFTLFLPRNLLFKRSLEAHCIENGGLWDFWLELINFHQGNYLVNYEIFLSFSLSKIYKKLVLVCTGFHDASIRCSIRCEEGVG